MTRLRVYYRGSVEYFEADLTEAAGVDLTGDAVKLALVPLGTDVADATWLTSEWDNDGTVDYARTSSPVTWADYALPKYQGFAQVTDSPEVPIIPLGVVVVSD